MKKTIVLFACMVLLSATLLEAGAEGGFRISGTAQFFQPSDQFFSDIYGSGMVFGGEIGVNLMMGVSLWAAADFYNQKGTLTFSGEETELQMIPIFGGLMYEFMTSNLRPYLGAGVGYFQYKETNVIGEVSGGDLGFIVRAGVRFHAFGPLFLDAMGSYSFCKSKSAAIEVELGGIRAGVGIGLVF